MPLDTTASLHSVFVYLPPPLREILEQLPPPLARNLEEIRIRQGRPLAIKTDQRDCFVDQRGQAVDMPSGAYMVTAEDVWKTVQLISQSSLYAFEEEFRQGFLTIPGGHRVGLAGKAVLEAGALKTLRDIGSLCFRIARAVPGAARNILPYLIDRQEGRPYHTLIVSPPRAGKTTVLRDLVRLLKRARVAATYINLETLYGHDSFLIENKEFANVLRHYLENEYAHGNLDQAAATI